MRCDMKYQQKQAERVLRYLSFSDINLLNNRYAKGERKSKQESALTSFLLNGDAAGGAT